MAKSYKEEGEEVRCSRGKAKVEKRAEEEEEEEERYGDGGIRGAKEEKEVNRRTSFLAFCRSIDRWIDGRSRR